MVQRGSVLILLFLLSLFFLWWSYSSVEYEKREQNLTQALQKKVIPGYLDQHILAAIEQEHFDDVVMYENLAKFLGQTLSPLTISQIEAHSGTIETSWRNIKAFASGFVNGEATNGVELSGSIASDLTLYGDIRDLKKEGSLYLDEQPYDAFILNISLMGIGLSASQLLSAGVFTPLKAGASVIKAAKKSGKLTKPFSKILSDKLSKTVNTKMLKTLDIQSLFKFEETTKAIEKSVDIKPMETLFNDISTIKQNTSLPDTIELMKYVDTPKELRHIVKISSQYKANTKGVMKVLGKDALRAGKSVIKWSMGFIYKFIGLVLSFLGFIILLGLKIKTIRHLKNIAS